MREYHGSFKSVCDTFAIDLSEFDQIFNLEKKEEAFKVWDTDNNGLIDALELFSGLIIFSETNKFEDKLRFLFDLFDFNELNSLSVIDIEFMIISLVNAVFKICLIEAEINEEEVSDFLGKYFTDDSRTNISQLLKWTQKVKEIHEFMDLI